MKLVCKTKDGMNSRDLYRIYLCAHPTEYENFVNEMIPQIHEQKNCAIFYKEDFSKPLTEDYLQEFNLIIVLASRALLCEANEIKDVELECAKKLRITILPILTDSNLQMEFSACFGNLQYLSHFSKGGGAIDFKDKLALYLLEKTIPTPLIERIKQAFSATLFLSYRKVDRELAQKIITIIHEEPAFQSVAVWYDEYLTLGEDFNSSIYEALDKSLIFILAITKNMVTEDNFVSEHEYPEAQKKGMPIIPVLVEEVETHLLNKRFPNLPPVKVEKKEVINAIAQLLKENGVASSQSDCPDYLIALAYFMGIYLERNVDIAISIFNRCAKEGDEEALSMLAQIYFSGERVKQNIPLAIKYQEALVKIKKQRFLSSKIAISLKEYTESIQTLIKMRFANKNYYKVLKLGKQLLKLNEKNTVYAYEVGAFNEFFTLFDYSRNETCLNMAKNFIKRGNYYPLAELARHIAKLSENADKKRVAFDYFNLLNEHLKLIEREKTNFGESGLNAFKRAIGELSDENGLGFEVSEYLKFKEDLPCDNLDEFLAIEEKTAGEEAGEPNLNETELSNSEKKNKKEIDLLNLIVPRWESPCVDYEVDEFKALFERTKYKGIIKRKKYSTANGFDSVEKANLFSKYLSATEIAGGILLKEDWLGNEITSWFEEAKLSPKNEKEAKLMAEIYERLLNCYLFNKSDIVRKLSEVYDYLSKAEPYKYEWLQKFAICQILIMKEVFYEDLEKAFEHANLAYTYLKKYSVVESGDKYQYDLAVVAFCVGHCLENLAKPEQELEYYKQSFDLLLAFNNGLEKVAHEQIVENFIAYSLIDNENPFDLIKKALNIVNDMPNGVQKDIKTANCYSAYANAHERMGALELANYYKRETVEIYCEIYKKDESCLYDYAKSIYELATFVWITDKEQALLLLNDMEALLNNKKEPTIFSQLLLVSVKNLRAWTMLENKEYESAVELFKECANQVESIEGFEKIELAVSTLFVSYKGLFNSYRRLKKRKMAFKTYFKCYKYSLKKQFTGQFIDIYLSIINNGLI